MPLIPDSRLADWTVGTNVGVDGGFEKYFNNSGDPDERNTVDFENAVTDHGADNTGATPTQAELAAAWSAASAGGGVFLPAGIYKITALLNLGAASRKTLRGEGTITVEGTVYPSCWTRSTSTNTISGSGNKTFTVAAGLPHTAGIGVRAWKRNYPSIYMQGLVDSYSGTTMVIDVSSSSGGSETLSDWCISITLIDADSAVSIGSGDDYTYFGGGTYGVMTGGAVTLASGADKGDTSIVVTDATGISTGQLACVYIKNLQTSAAFLAGESTVMQWSSANGYETQWVRRAMCRVAGVSGTTITLDAPLPFDLPIGLEPRFHSSSSYADRVGIEGIAVACNGTTPTGFTINQTVNCWFVGSEVLYPANYGFNMAATYKTEIRRCGSFERSGGPTASNGAAALLNNCGNTLLADTILFGVFPGIEMNAGSSNNAFVGVFIANDYGLGTLNVNHGPHNSFNLQEQCIANYWQSDGYFGSQSNDTINQNWFNGDGDSINLPLIVSNRGAYNNNFVGNVIGDASASRSGFFSYGNPNIGNSSNSGLVNQPVVDGSFWLHFNGTGTLTGTVTDQQNRVFDLSPLDKSALEVPNIDSSSVGNPMSVFWETWTSSKKTVGTVTLSSTATVTLSGGHADWSVTSITRSGQTATVTTSAPHGLSGNAVQLIVNPLGIWISGAAQAEYNGTFLLTDIPSATTFTYTVSGSPATPATGTIVANDFPAVGSTVIVCPQGAGFQEVDSQTEATAIQKGNYLVVNSGGSQESTGGDHLVTSYAYGGSLPPWWTGSLAGITPSSPVYSYEIIPAGYRFVNGEDPPTAGSVAFDGSGSTTFTGAGSVTFG